MRKWINLLLMSLWITGVVSASSCTATIQRVAPPPLPERPVLESITKDRNDQTGEMGFWMSVADLRKLTKFAEDIEAVRERWK